MQYFIMGSPPPHHPPTLEEGGFAAHIEAHLLAAQLEPHLRELKRQPSAAR